MKESLMKKEKEIEIEIEYLRESNLFNTYIGKYLKQIVNDVKVEEEDEEDEEEEGEIELKFQKDFNHPLDIYLTLKFEELLIVII